MTDDPASPSLPEWLQAHMKSDDEAIVRIDERLRAIKEALDKALAAHETRLSAHDTEIRALQLWRAGLAGAFGVIAALVGYLWGK